MFDNFQGMLALPEDPNKNAAARQGLLAFGASLLGGQGNFGGILGDGLMAGTQTYNGALAQQQQQALRQVQLDQTKLENTKLQAAADKPGQIASVFSGMRAPGAQPSITAPGAPGISGPRRLPTIDASLDGYTPRSISDLPKIGQPPAPASASAPRAAPTDWSAFYRQRGDALAEAGLTAEAKEQYDMAEKLRPKLKEQRALTVGGKRIMVNVFEDGTIQQLDGFDPDAEKAHFANTGGSTVAFDPYTGKPINTVRNTQSPDSVASVEVQKRGQNLANERAKEQLAQGRTPAGYRQNPDGTLSPILGGPADPRNKPPTEFQGKSAAFGARAAEADKILSELQGQYRPAAINAKTSVENAWLVGGALGAGLNKYSLTDNDQKAEQAQRDFVNAVLRQESGAAISDGEFINAKKQYFPQPGDSKAVIEQKAKNRRVAIQGFKVNSGHAAFSAPSAAPPPNSGVTFLGFE